MAAQTATASLAHALTRSHRLRALIDQEQRRTGGPRLRLLRLQKLLLQAQVRLAAALDRRSARPLRAHPA